MVHVYPPFHIFLSFGKSGENVASEGKRRDRGETGSGRKQATTARLLKPGDFRKDFSRKFGNSSSQNLIRKIVMIDAKNGMIDVDNASPV